MNDAERTESAPSDAFVCSRADGPPDSDDSCRSRDERLPCPFCGSSDVDLEDNREGYYTAWFMACNQCQAQGPYVIAGKGPKAAALWNERAGQVAALSGAPIAYVYCGICKKPMTEVRPGKWQCDNDRCGVEKSE